MNKISKRQSDFSIVFREGDNGRPHENYWRFKALCGEGNIITALNRMKLELPKGDVLSVRKNLTVKNASEAPMIRFVVRANRGNLDTLSSIFENFREARRAKLNILIANKHVEIGDNDPFRHYAEIAEQEGAYYMKGVQADLGKWATVGTS